MTVSGRVVDDDVHAGRGLEGADVPSLAADDAALHLVVGERDGGDGGLGGVLRREPLGGDGDDAAGVAVGALLGLLLDVAHQRRGLPPGLVLHPLEDLAARVLGGESRDPLQPEPAAPAPACRPRPRGPGAPAPSVPASPRACRGSAPGRSSPRPSGPAPGSAPPPAARPAPTPRACAGCSRSSSSRSLRVSILAASTTSALAASAARAASARTARPRAQSRCGRPASRCAVASTPAPARCWLRGG